MDTPVGHGPSAHLGEHAEHGGINKYLVVFAALSIFTIVSFVVNGAVRGGSLTPTTGFLIILGVAVCKAVLVAAIFMHLSLDWGRVYFIIIPVMVLGVLMMIVLMPDVVLGWKNYPY